MADYVQSTNWKN